jgi:hypothetical protein
MITPPVLYQGISVFRLKPREQEFQTHFDGPTSTEREGTEKGDKK